MYRHYLALILCANLLYSNCILGKNLGSSSYWQEFGAENMVRLNVGYNQNIRYDVNTSKTAFNFITDTEDKAELKLLETILIADGRLKDTALKIKIIRNPYREHITVPQGITAAVQMSDERLQDLKPFFVEDDSNVANYFFIIQEFMLQLSPKTIAAAYLLTMDDNHKVQHIVSKGVTINMEFYNKHLQKYELGQNKCYSLLFALNQLYNISNNWQLSVTNNKLTKFDQLLTIVKA